ncbi:MAG TPA: glycosyltransferase family 4 protein [Bryobacteraceae bacterium]|nr:glycosyltransferase family 4 protein [Bryobacteraceae bacterium]
MNILCLDQFSDLGGAQRCLLDLLPALVRRGWNVQVAAPGNGELLRRAAAAGATPDSIHCGPYSSGKKTPGDVARFAVETPRLAGEIARLARRCAADLIYVNGPRLLPAVAIGARGGRRVLFHAHSRLDGYTLRLAGRSLAMRHASVAASCRFAGSPLLPYLGERGFRVVYNGVSPMLSVRPAHNLAELRAGVIGRISPEKGQADFLRAARIVYRELPQSRFVICGAPLFGDPKASRYQEELRRLAVDLPVEFTGWTDNVPGVLDTLDLLVVPSSAVDATPRVILEAFAAGVPVMAFASGGIPEMIEPGVTGFLVDQRSPEPLATTMLELLGQPCRMRETAGRARMNACNDFSLERYQEEMIAAIEAAL